MTLKKYEADTKIGIALSELRDAILDNTFPPGHQLKQSIIAEELGMSQGPVREALSRLVEEGLVEHIKHRGMFVRRLSKRDFLEIYQVRASLESLAAKLAKSKFSEPETWNQLKNMAQKIIDYQDEERYIEAVNADLEFHRFLVKLGGNSYLMNIWDTLLAQSKYALRRLYELSGDNYSETLSHNHLDLLDVLRESTEEQIQEAFQEHMEFAVSTLFDNWSLIEEGERKPERNPRNEY